jgi:predicted cupin superfamily sugar epimerase
MANSAQKIIDRLNLQPHPEGGFYSEIYRATALPGDRSTVTSIYYLLAAGQRSAWHRIDATEIWHFHDGAPLRLSLSEAGLQTDHVLGTDMDAGQQPQVVVPPRVWQSAQTLGDWTLVGCTVAPGFDFAGFELAPGDQLPDRD